MKRKLRIVLCFALILSMLVTLTGCGNDKSNEKPSATNSSSVSGAASTNTEDASQPTSNAVSEPAAGAVRPSATPEIVSVDYLTDTQRNSINMLNYLAVVTQEINASKNSRLFLEETYSTLINNTDPSTVDEWTLAEYDNLLDTLEDYRLIAVKRDRLNYIYEQNQAKAIRDAIPSPIGLLGAVMSKKETAALIVSALYMAYDAYSSYASASISNELKFIQDGWELDDEEAAVLHNRRKDAFFYMIRMVGDYNLPGYMSLSESAVDRYVEKKSSITDSNVVRTIQFLEDNKETYQAFGDYWLTLADCYYRNGEYTKCLDAVSTYEALGIKIFRRDYGLARTLPIAIVAASEVYEDNAYISAAERYAQMIIDNTDYASDWALRYFVAQTYIDLYSRTNDDKYLKSAYDIIKGNVTVLVEEQEKLNETYLAPVSLIKVPADATKAQKSKIEENNEQLKAYRDKELAPIYSPLLLNCDLLFSLADALALPQSEIDKLEAILRPDGNAIFLVPAIDNLYRFGEAEALPSPDEYTIDFEDGEILTLPATLVTEDAVITVAIYKDAEAEPRIINDWKVSSVKRGSQKKIKTFTVSYTSKTAENFKYSEGERIEITVKAKSDCDVEPVVFKYHTTAKGDWYTLGITETIIFTRDKQ